MASWLDRSYALRSLAVHRRPRLAVVVALVALGACSGHRQNTSDQGRSIAGQAGLAPDVADFFALTAQGPHAAYRSTLSTTDTGGKPVQLTTTQRPPDLRIDTFHSDGTIDSTITVGGQSYQCTMAANHWDCGALGLSPSSTPGVFSPTVVQAAIDTFKQRAADYDFRVESRPIAGVTARCLITTLKSGHASDSTLGASGTLCLSPEGAIVLIETPAGTVTATEYTTTIPADAFNLPAPVPSSTSETTVPTTATVPPSTTAN
jgi:hypothetical protein